MQPPLHPTHHPSPRLSLLWPASQLAPVLSPAPPHPAQSPLMGLLLLLGPCVSQGDRKSDSLWRTPAPDSCGPLTGNVAAGVAVTFPRALLGSPCCLPRPTSNLRPPGGACVWCRPAVEMRVSTAGHIHCLSPFPVTPPSPSSFLLSLPTLLSPERPFLSQPGPGASELPPERLASMPALCPQAR